MKTWIFKRIRNILCMVSPALLCRIIYKRNTGKELNLKSPKSFDEKINWLKLNDYKENKIVAKCADKYKVREFAQERGCGEILNDLIAVWNSVDEIIWSDLPDEFAIKCNHGCGYNLICMDKKALNLEEAKRSLKRWMSEDYWKQYAEFQYRDIEKKIICEHYIKTDQGHFPIDYKFYCVRGNPKLILIKQKIPGAKDYDRVFVDTDWNLVRFDANANKTSDLRIPEKPNCFDDMVKYAKSLSAGFPFVRVDLYALNDSVLFGELTFSPRGGFAPPGDLPVLDKFLADVDIG